MPGRNDFGILLARSLADPRIVRAADRYVELRIARKETALAAVLGHVTCLGLWLSTNTNDGRMNGDGASVVAAATLCGMPVAQKVVEALSAPDVDLITRDAEGLRMRGFAEAYAPLLSRRAKTAERVQKYRSAQPSADPSGNAYVTRDVTRTSPPSDTLGPRAGARAPAHLAPARARTPAPAPACDARAASPEPAGNAYVTQAYGDTGPDRTVDSPPPPGAGGELVASRPEGEPHSDAPSPASSTPAAEAPPDDPDDSPAEAPGRPLRPRTRERLGRVLDHVVRHGAAGERHEAQVLRLRYRAGGIPDPEVLELLQRFAWVTPERLAKARRSPA